MGTRVTGGKAPKKKKKCPICKGTKVLPWKIAKELPRPARNLQCTFCKGKGTV